MGTVTKKDLEYVAARSIMEWGTPPRHACAYLSVTKPTKINPFHLKSGEQMHYSLSYVLSVCTQHSRFNQPAGKEKRKRSCYR